MKIFFVVVLILLSNLFSQANAEDVVYLAIQDATPSFGETTLPSQIDESKKDEELKFELYENDTSLTTDIVSEKNSTSPLETEIEYNVLYERTPLLSEYTSMTFEKGPIETLKPFFAYSGQFNFNYLGNPNYNTTYTTPSAEIILRGKFRDKPIEYFFLMNFIGLKGYNFFQTMFRDDFITFKYIPNNDIVVGNFRTPIGVEGGMSGYTLPFISRSQISRNFGSVRGTGIKILGDYEFVEYNIGATSTDRNFTKFMPGVEFNGLVNFKPLANTEGRYGVLKVGGGLHAGHRDFDYTVASAFISYKFRKFAVESEYAISNGSNGLTGLTRKKAQGLYTTLSYNITKKFQILARYDFFDNDRTLAGGKSTEYTAGLNYFIKGSALKFMLNYTLRHSDYESTSNRIMFATQILL